MLFNNEWYFSIKKHSFRTIVIALSCLVLSSPLFAQIVIKGRVIDSKTQTPLAFVTVLLKGINVGTETNENGYYEVVAYDTPSHIEFNYMGYKKYQHPLSLKPIQVINAQLQEESKILKEVTIKSKKEKYRNKNNPAVELIREVIKHKDKNRISSADQVQFKEYEKLQLSLVDPPDYLKNNFVFKHHGYIFDNVDTLSLPGKKLLPIFIEETLANEYYTNTPKRHKKVIIANKKINYDERFISVDNISSFFGHFYQNIDIYESNIYLLGNTFISPISTFAPNFYRFYIVDTTEVEGIKTVQLAFGARNKSDILFNGFLYITLDGNYAVQHADLSVSEHINLNWLNNLKIKLSFKKNEANKFYLYKNTLSATFGIFDDSDDAFGERTVLLTDFDFQTPIPDSVFQGLEIEKKSQLKQADSFWVNNRPEKLSDVESQGYENIQKLNSNKRFIRILDWSTALLAGYKAVGPFELGPTSTFYSFNPVEGSRIRLGGRSTTRLSTRFFTEGFIAYGTKDQQFKYMVGGAYSFNNKSIYTFPMNFIKISHAYETKIPGQDLQFVQEDNILLSFKRGINDRWQYNRTTKIDYLVEYASHMSLGISLEHTTQTPGGSIHYVRPDESNRWGDTLKNITVSEVSASWRWAPNEEFYDRKLFRKPIINRYPVFTLGVTFALKDFLGGDYNYQRIDASIFKRVYLSQIGTADFSLQGGYIFGKVPYPLMFIGRANQTYAFQLNSFSMMNFFEFVGDQYINLIVDYQMRGFILNKIPLLKKLKWREVASFKMMYGAVRDENNPQYNKETLNFPVNPYGTPTTYALDPKMPYIEAGVGIDNILNFIRIELVKRFTQLNHPNVADWGIRFRFHFDF